MTDPEYREIGEKIKRIRAQIAENAMAKNVTLLCATKTIEAKTINYVKENFDIDSIGENKAQELLDKYPCLQKHGLSIHFIGSLQSNKVKSIIDKVDLIHSLDSLSLAKEINKRAFECGKIMDVLIEINIAHEQDKSGILPKDVFDFAEQLAILDSVRIRGVMTMGPVGCTSSEYRKYFTYTKEIFEKLKEKKVQNTEYTHLSMGMSNSYIEALKCGATIIRLGGAVFGARKQI